MSNHIPYNNNLNKQALPIDEAKLIEDNKKVMELVKKVIEVLKDEPLDLCYITLASLADAIILKQGKDYIPNFEDWVDDK